MTDPDFEASGETTDGGATRPPANPAFDPVGDTIDESQGPAQPSHPPTHIQTHPSTHPQFDSNAVTMDTSTSSQLVQPPQPPQPPQVARPASELLSDPSFREQVTLLEGQGPTEAQHSQSPTHDDVVAATHLETGMESGHERTAADARDGVEQSLATKRHKRPSQIRTRMPKRIGNYEPIKELGRGGMGVVYAARHLRTERKAAIKVLHNRGEGVSESVIARFHVEARAAGRLKHPNIVSVFDQDLDPNSDQWFLAMDLVEGRSLYEKVSQDGPYSDHDAAALLVQLADAVAHAHSQKVLHRDLKPQNVLLDASQNDKPLVTDFGLAKLVGDDTNLTGVGPTMMGTPGFMPPEQAGAGPVVDERADVYALGSTLYFALTGKAPFAGGSVAMVLSRVVHKAPPKPTSIKPEISRDLETIVLKCLEKDPEHRYPSAAYLKADLERFLASQKIVAVRPPALVQLKRWAGRNKGQAVSLASALLLAIGGLTVSAVILSQQARQKEVLEQREREVVKQKEEIKELKTTVTEREKEVEKKIVELESIPPTMEIKHPSERGFVTRESSIEVRVWIPDDDVKQVTLNGGLVPLTVDAGTYATRWELEEEGHNRATLVAEDKNGNRSEREIVVVRDTTPPSFSWTHEPIGYELEGDEGTVTAVKVRINLDVAEVISPTVTLGVLQGETLSEVPLTEVKGGWEGEVPLALGGNRLKVVLGDNYGNTVADERVVQRLEPKVLAGADWPVHPQQRAFAIELGVPVEIKNSVGLEFALIPPGSFAMGSPPGEAGREDATSVGRETLHQVELTSGFYMSRTEITQAQYRRVLSQREDDTPSEGDDEPVVNITWEAAQHFCKLLGEAEGRPKRYRLPTEAEWEYACRAGTTTAWFWGEDPREAGAYGNVAGLQARVPLAIVSKDHVFPVDDGGHILTAPVARYRPNPFGLYDMVGNVAEWCFDLLQQNLTDQPARDPDGPENNPSGYRIFRGGSYADRPAWTRSASRRAWGKSLKTIGFRVVRIID